VSRTGRVALRVADGAAALTGLQCAYLLGLCVAALRQTGSAPDALPPLRLVVLVPAHDERLTITDAVRSLTSCEYPPDHRTVIVIADNCGDETAQLAREAGAEASNVTIPCTLARERRSPGR
jgi:cellulose synthase/poly-beta-1,6-N-acetylglucosamine synthase-like glycosyltransferase